MKFMTYKWLSILVCRSQNVLLLIIGSDWRNKVPVKILIPCLKFEWPNILRCSLSFEFFERHLQYFLNVSNMKGGNCICSSSKFEQKKIIFLNIIYLWLYNDPNLRHNNKNRFRYFYCVHKILTTHSEEINNSYNRYFEIINIHTLNISLTHFVLSAYTRENEYTFNGVARLVPGLQIQWAIAAKAGITSSSIL